MRYMLSVQRKELRIDHLTLFLIVAMPYAGHFLWRAYHIEDFKWRLHFQSGVAFWRVDLREVYYEGPHHVRGHWRLQSWNTRHTYHRGHDFVTLLGHLYMWPQVWQREWGFRVKWGFSGGVFVLAIGGGGLWRIKGPLSVFIISMGEGGPSMKHG